LLRETTASGLFVGMRVPVLDSENQTVTNEEITEISQIEGSFIDLDVLDSSTFFANNILTSNSIYEFRGADPEVFIDMSDLVEGGAGFKTEVLKTNYRSGKLIVDAANRLISHNKKQIPMTCQANPQRVDQGGIETKRFTPQESGSMAVPAEWLAQQIAEAMGEGRAGPKTYDAFGVALRSNAEAYTYGLELLKKGIPFRAKVNFFTDPSTKALLHWLTIADEGLSGNVDRINAAVLGARTAPATKLGATFETKLTEQATGNYILWLKDNWHHIYGRSGNWAELVQQYTKNLLEIASLEGMDAEEVLNTILGLEGFDGRTVKDVLLDRVREDEEALAEIRAESLSGTVTEEDIAEVAFAPLEPLIGLLNARANLTESMKYARQLQEANAKLTAVDDPEAPKVNEPAVTLGTMHSWKGLEVENMFVPFVGGKFPRSDSTEDSLASERRLAYVAITRGEHRVTVMDVPIVKQTKKGAVVLHSRFVDELCVPPAKSPIPQDTEPVIPSAAESPLDDHVITAYLKGQK
jgi:DNA helicase-2/ATP-dependent DNA helicase PcrA